MRRSITGIQNFFVIEETFRNFYPSYSCGFKIYMKDKPGNYDISFISRGSYASIVMPYVTPPINNPEKKENIYDLVMEITKDILNPKRNVTGDRLYYTIDTVEELHQKTNNLC